MLRAPSGADESPLENKEGDEEWRGSCPSRLKDLGLFSLVKALRGHYSSLQVKINK